MARMRFNRVAALPAQLMPGSFYFVESGQFAESYLTDSNGVEKAIGNTPMIQSVVSTQIAAAMASYSSLQVSATYGDLAKLPKNSSYLALVVDATGDATVKSGSALYAFDKVAAKWMKVAEYESMDVVLQWAAIQGGPVSTPAQIDASVGQSHTHANKATIDKLGEDADGLTFNGNGVEARWSTVNW